MGEQPTDSTTFNGVTYGRPSAPSDPSGLAADSLHNTNFDHGEAGRSIQIHTVSDGIRRLAFRIQRRSVRPATPRTVRTPVRPALRQFPQCRRDRQRAVPSLAETSNNTDMGCPRPNSSTSAFVECSPLSIRNFTITNPPSKIPSPVEGITERPASRCHHQGCVTRGRRTAI